MGVLRRVDLSVIVLWLALGASLAAVTSRVADWYVMTDELLYERLALSIVDLHSPLPHIHGELIDNVNQLYPLLIAPLFHDTLVPPALHHAHILNAFVMSSASIPAFFLARSVTQSLAWSHLVAVLSVCIPWIALSSFLMTEVVAYPIFLCTVLALYHAAVSPRPRNDVLLLFVLAVAILARTQFAVFLVVLPIALVIHAVAFDGIRPAARTLWATHRVLAVLYAGLAVAAVALLAVGRLTSVLGTYSDTAEGDLLPSGMGRGLLEHLAPIGLGLGILPFVLGVSWLLATLIGSRMREQHAFACIAVVTIVVLLFEVTSYDLRFGQGRLHDRYLFYVVPLVLIAYASLLRETTWSRWSVFVSTGLLAMAFAFMPVIRSDKFNVDSPVAVFNGGMLDLTGSINGARLLLAFATIAATLMFLAGSLFLSRPRLTALLLAIAVLVIPAETGAAFTRLFTADGTSGRPLTLDQGTLFDWVDRKLSPTTKVTMIPYPLLYGDYWSNVAYWWNMEFWNASVQRAAVYEEAFTGTPETFPKISLSFDRSSGRANVSPGDYVVQAVAETRFHLAGTLLATDRGAALMKVQKPWRADWLAFDLYRDGWTVPRVVGTIRVFAASGQTDPKMRFLTVSVRGPRDVAPRPFRVISNASDWRGTAGTAPISNQVSVCVPPKGFADLQVDAPHFSPIYGDPRSEASFFSYARSGGVLVTGIALADETGPC